MFVDADDEVDVELVSKLILDSGGYDLISVGRKDIYSDHDEIIDYGNMEIDINFKMNQKLFDELFNKRFFNTVYTKLFVKEKVTAQFDEGISYGEDCLFILEYLKNCTKLLFLSDCYYNYYIYEESLTTKLHNNEFYVIKKINKSICELMRFWELNNTDCVDLFSSNSLIFYIQKRFENNSISVHELKRIYNDNWVKKVLMKNLPTSRDWRIYKSRCIYVVYFYFKVKVFLKKRKKYYEKNWNFNN